MADIDWKRFSDYLINKTVELNKLVATEPAERGRAIGSAAIVLGCIANAVQASLTNSNAEGAAE